MLFKSISACLLVLLSSCPLSIAQDAPTLLKGKIIDSDGNPVAGAKIVLHDEERDEKKSGKTNSKGEFAIEHQACSFVSFDAMPPKKSGLTSAHYSHVSGEVSKHVIVRLHKGFLVSGRILSEGRGVKGLEVKAIATEKGKHGNDSTIHGGGKSVTDSEGNYTLTLTPGKKTIQIKNELYSNLSPLYQHEFTITGDSKLPDMTLPLVKN